MTIRTYPQYPQSVYLASSSTQGSFTLTAGRKAIANTSGVLHLSGNTSHVLVPLNGARGAAIQFFGTDAADETFDARIWAGTFAFSSGQTSPLDAADKASFIDLNYIGAATSVTLSTAAGVSSSDLVPATSFIADAITWAAASDSTSPDGIQTVSETAYGLGASTVYSPGANVPATLLIPNLGAFAHAFLIEFDLTGAASANALYTLTA